MLSDWLTPTRKSLIGRRDLSRLVAVPLMILTLAILGLPSDISSYALTTQIAPATLATNRARIGQSYHATLSFGNGTTWAVTSGELPPGLVLDRGSIKGVPTQAGEFTFAVRASASNGSTSTNTYSIFVYPQPSTGYESRVNASIQDHIDHPWPPMTGCTDHVGYLNYGLAALWLNKNTADANNKLAHVRITHITGENCGPVDPSMANLWLGYLVRPYLLYSAGSSFFPGRMTTAASDNLAAQMWAYARPYSKVSQAPDPWNIYGSENHDAQAESFNLLSAQAFKNRADYRNRIYADGSTVSRQYQAWRDHWSKYFDEGAKRGLFIEAGAPSYHGYTLQAIFNIYNFAEDPVLRKKAGMYLDLDFADYAHQQLNHIWGGAKSRSYPSDSYNGQTDAMTYFANLLYGSQPAYGNHIMALATSGYSPPPVVTSLVRDAAGKGSYEYVSRRPGVGPSSWDNKDWHVDRTKSVLDYAYSTPDYVLGTAELRPGDSHIGPSNQNRWQGIIFNTTPGDRVYPQAVPTSVNKTQDAFLSVQKKNVLITRKIGYTDQPTLVYFPASLDTVAEQRGWVFVKEGSSYLAVRPAMGTYGWLTSAKNKAARIDDRFIKLSAVSSPIVFEASRASAYTTFAAFKADILDNALSVTNGVVHYTASNGTNFTFFAGATSPRVNGVPINYAPSLVFNSPFMKSVWGSGKITISKGSFSATYDFSDPAHPVKRAT
jgi:hypothetical protein